MFFWKGTDANEPRVYGVQLAIITELVKKHGLISTLSSERLMPIEILLLNKTYLILFSVCAPTLDSVDRIS